MSQLNLEEIKKTWKPFNEVDALNSQNYTVNISGITYGIKRIPKDYNEISNKKEDIKKSVVLSEVYFLKKLKKIQKINFSVYVDLLQDSKFSYIVSHWVKGTTLFNWLKEEQSSKDLYSIFYQIFICIDYLNSTMKFIHGDMLPQNILLKKIENKKGHIKYNSNQKSYYVKNETNYVPVIWDYGFTRETKENEDFGYYKIQEIVSTKKYDAKISDYMDLLNSFLYQRYSKNAWFYNPLKILIQNIYNNGFSETFSSIGLEKLKEDVILEI